MAATHRFLARALALAFATPLAAQAAHQVLGEVTVTGTREARLLSETPASIGKVEEGDLLRQRPTHPSAIMNQIAGVRVSNLSGEGHSTAIRQPLTTSPVYLFLEDGIPTRSTGFFNHNALYEINVPQAGGVEVLKGPGTALYGSDAIGGTVNVLTRTPPRAAEAEASVEAGSHGWKRLLASGGNAHGDDAWRVSLNLTENDGWQRDAGYERQTGTLRWDHALAGDTLLKTVLSFSHVDQTHVGSLSAREYVEARRNNNIPFSYRKVDALRLSTTFEKEGHNSLLTLIPYVRDNRMEIVPSWTVSYDPNQYVTENQSIGFLAKYRHDFAPMRARLITGVDVDLSPGSRAEDTIALTRSSNEYGGRVYARNTAVSPVRIYQYDVTYRGISPYVQGEISPLEPLRLTLGLRYDDMRYDYENRFNGGIAGATQGVAGAFPGGGWYGHVASSEVAYHHWGPKLGATWALDRDNSLFASYSNSFRAPSESQVFRGSRESSAARAQAAAESLLQLKPVVVDSYEMGVRGQRGTLRYAAALYTMYKKDDIVSYTDPATNQRSVVNAGETRHQGVELELGLPLGSGWQLDAGLSYARHTYEKWLVSGTVDYSGKEMEAAPRLMTNTRLSCAPGVLNGGRVQLEWVRLGSYWHDQANTVRYGGHDLFNLRANYRLARQFETFVAVNNLFDKAYAETVGVDQGAPTYTSGLPRSLVLGVQAKW